MSPTVKFAHPNKRADIVLFTHQIVGAMEMPEQKCVAVIGLGSALVPVAGTLQEIIAAIQAATKELTTNE